MKPGILAVPAARWTLVTTAVVAAVIASVATCRRWRTPPPDQAVQRLTTVRHGLIFLAGDDRKLLDQVRKNPSRYLPVVRQQVELPRDLRLLLEPARQQAFLGALELLFAMGNDDALEVAAGTHEAVLRYLDAEWRFVRDRRLGLRRTIPPFSWLMIQTQRLLFDRFALVRSKRVVDSAVEVLKLGDYASAMNALQYLLAVARGDRAVAQRAEDAANSPGSAVAGDSTAVILLRALRQGP